MRVEIEPPKYKVKVDRPQKDREAVREIVEDAQQRTEPFDLGPDVWYRTRFSFQTEIMSELGQLHFMRFLSEHSAVRLSGPVRLTNDVLLEFDQSQSDPTPHAIPSALRLTSRWERQDWGQDPLHNVPSLNRQL
jgi:hypothetical protein